MMRINRVFIMFVIGALILSACQPVVAQAAVANDTLDESMTNNDEPADSPLTLLGHVAGPIVSLAVQGNHAYLGHSFELAVVDISDRSQPMLIASLPIPSTDVAVAGQFAYVGGRVGLSVIDVTDPANPLQISALPYPATVTSVVVADGFAALIEGKYLHVIAVSDAAHIREVGSMRLDKEPESLAVVDGRAYVTDYSGIRIVDISNPQRPVTLGRIETSVAPSELTFSGQDGYFVSGGVFYRFDITDPSRVKALNKSAFSYWVRNLTIVDGLAFLSAGTAGLRIWDVSERDTAGEIGSYHTAGLALANDVTQDKLFLIDCDEGLLIFDVADPTQPRVAGTLPIMGVLTNVAVAGDFVYATAGFNGRLHLLDARDPAQANGLILHLTTQRVDAFVLANKRALLLADDTLFILDLSQSAIPRQVGAVTLAGVMAIYADSTYAYLVDSLGDLTVLNLADAAHAKLVATYKMQGYTNTMVVQDGIAYLHQMDAGLVVMAIGVDGQLTRVGALPMLSEIPKIVAAKGYLLLAAGSDGLIVVDVADPSTPTIVARYRGIADAHDIALDDDRAFVAAGKAGVSVLDISDPRNPAPLGSQPATDCASQVIVDNGRLYVGDAYGGLLIFGTEGESTR